MTDARQFRFKATLRLLAQAEGGRNTPAIVGEGKYRPLFRLRGQGPMSSAFIESVENGNTTIAPGEKVDVELMLLFPQEFANEIEPGVAFELCEGLKVVGLGTISEITSRPD